MKLRALSFNKTLLRKDIFRFTPLWAIYLIGGLLVMLPNLSIETGTRAAYELASTMGPFAVINMIYAVLVAQMLFGDLFNSRLCNALHALPMRRATWFGTHIVSGLLYSIVPHLIAAIFFLPQLGQFGWVALAWVAVMLMEYLFFFGAAVFCVMCTGNRFAQVAVYAIVNFFSLIVYWFVTVIYQPVLYGVRISEDVFALFCPVVKMTGFTELLQFDWRVEINLVTSERGWVYMGPGEGWGYLGICAGIGVALMAAALVLYRRRKLECAGEFIAIERLKPVFAVVFALCTGAVVAMFGQIINSDNGYLVFLIIGLVIGWFAGQMLLQRTVRVFKGKTVARLVGLCLALALTVGITAWDPIGITRYVPKADNVKRAEVTQGMLYEYSKPDIDTDNTEDIEEIIQIHKKALEERGQYTGNYRTITIRYTMESGYEITRVYKVYTDSRTWMKVQNLYNKPVNLLGETQWADWYTSVKSVYFNSHTIKDMVSQYNEIKKGELTQPLSAHTMQTELLMAIWQDGSVGNIANFQVVGKEFSKFYVTIERVNKEGYHEANEYYILSRSENCQQWLKKYADVLLVFGLY